MMILTERFPDADVNAVKPRLEAIGDFNRLKQLNRDAFFAPSFQAFQEGLDA